MNQTHALPNMQRMTFIADACKVITKSVNISFHPYLRTFQINDFNLRDTETGERKHAANGSLSFLLCFNSDPLSVLDSLIKERKDKQKGPQIFPFLT